MMWCIPDYIDDVLPCLDQLRVEVAHGGYYRVYEAMKEARRSL